MSQAIITAVEIHDRSLAKTILADVKQLPNVNPIEWFNNIGEKGPLATKTIPDIIIIDDDPTVSIIFTRVQSLRQSFPQAAIFVVSPIKRPEHIIQVMKMGVAEYLIAPVDQKHLQDSIEEVRAHLATTGKIAKGDTHSFISSKGGLGASVLAVNTAVALAIHGAEAVALCDLSLQSGDCSVFLDLVPQTTITDVCRKFHALDIAMLRGAMSKHSSGVELLAAPESPENNDEITPEHLHKILNLTAKLYNDTIIDCQSMFIDERTIEAFNISTNIFIITDLSIPSVRNAYRINKRILESGVGKEKIHFVANRFLKSQTSSIPAVEDTLHQKLYWLFPNDFDDAHSAINNGIPIMQLHPHAALSKNIISFTQKIRNLSNDNDYRGARGTFGKAI